MLKFTTHNLKKLQNLLEEQEYVIRYEKGNFQSGYCLVENKKIILINRFYDTEGRINCLLEILSKAEINEANFLEKSLQFYKKIFPDTAAEQPELFDEQS